MSLSFAHAANSVGRHFVLSTYRALTLQLIIILSIYNIYKVLTGGVGIGWLHPEENYSFVVSILTLAAAAPAYVLVACVTFTTQC
jgi:hypothetical protein